MKKLCFLLLATLSIPFNPTFAQQSSSSCDSPVYEERSKELQKIVKADQDDRQTMTIPPEVVLRDTTRRMRVGEIFGEGCMKSAADFSAAALIYQHGSVPEHFFQTFLWSKRAVELGDTSQKRMMGLGLDRYLVNIGKKQLFASQATKPNGTNTCWCLQPVEKSFPDDKRIEYTNRSLSDAFKWVNDLNKNTACPAATECNSPLKSSPAGSVPGFW
jgi:hypothetical protein